MLIINNGTFKSGSTWTNAILRRAFDLRAPPKKYLNPEWRNASILPSMLERLTSELDFADNHYLVKNHFAEKAQRDLLLGCENIKVVGITRDLRDVLISAYFHFKRIENYEESFQTYYWQRGRKLASFIVRYNDLWAVSADNLIVLSYESMKENPHEETKRLLEFVDLKPLQDEAIKEIVVMTSFDSMKSKSITGHVREGKVDAYHKYFDEKMLLDTIEIENNVGIEKKTTTERIKNYLRQVAKLYQ